MEKYAVYGGGKPEKVPFEYEIGEIITVNSVDKMMCKKKEVKQGKLIQYFSKGRVVFD
ncbi:hypothetical protein ACI3ER_11975 [Bacillus sp. Wb]